MGIVHTPSFRAATSTLPYACPEPTRQELITDMRKAFGELHDSPNVANVYQKLPTDILRTVAAKARSLQGMLMFDFGGGYAATMAATTIGALTHDFGGAAAGFLIGASLTAVKIADTNRQLVRLQESLPALLPSISPDTLS